MLHGTGDELLWMVSISSVFLTAFEKYINSCVSPLIQFKVEKAKLTFFNFCNSSSISIFPPYFSACNTAHRSSPASTSASLLPVSYNKSEMSEMWVYDQSIHSIQSTIPPLKTSCLSVIRTIRGWKECSCPSCLHQVGTEQEHNW